MPQYLNKEQTYLIKKQRYFKHKKKGYIAYNYSRKWKIAVILEGFIKKNSN